MAEKNYFEVLNAVNVNEKTEKKNGLTYLSWAWAWAEVKRRHPDANYTVYERPDGVIYWTDGRTCWVKTGLTINGIEHIEYLPVMDHRNRSVPADAVTSMDVNKAIQRSLTKAAARHGLGLYIYAGEDLPEEDKPVCICQRCGKQILPTMSTKGMKSVEEQLAFSRKAFGMDYCLACSQDEFTKAKKAAQNVKEEKESA